MRLRKALLLALAVVLCALALAAPAQATIYSGRIYAKGWVSYSGAVWIGARANIEVRNGAISDADAANGGYAAEALWIGPNMSGTYWVEVGYSRGWGGDNIVTFYWANRNTTSPYYHEHKVWNLNAAAYVGTSPEFKIVRVGSSDDWNVYIDGIYANDAGDDHTANTTFTSIDHFDVGLESNCSSGRLGASTDYVNASTLQKKVPSGSWSYGPAYSGFGDGFQLVELNSSSPFAHGAWSTAGQRLWNWRNY
ncbi:MAG TPA: hypothetical protein VJ787_01470 [Thermoleophilia bacterium]|nr:hypothetical protein [Thermoleophilia bacterium]